LPHLRLLNTPSISQPLLVFCIIQLVQDLFFVPYPSISTNQTIYDDNHMFKIDIFVAKLLSRLLLSSLFINYESRYLKTIDLHKLEQTSTQVKGSKDTSHQSAA